VTHSIEPSIGVSQRTRQKEQQHGAKEHQQSSEQHLEDGLHSFSSPGTSVLALPAGENLSGRDQQESLIVMRLFTGSEGFHVLDNRI